MGQTAVIVQLLAAAVASPTEKRPISPWSVEYAPNMCLLSRAFGGTAQKPDLTLALRPLPFSTRAEVVLATPLQGAMPAKKGRMTMVLLPGGKPQHIPFTRWRNDVTGSVMTGFDVPTEFLDTLRGAEAIELATGDQPPVRLPIGKMSKAVASLEPCQDDLLKGWGYDPAIKDRIGKPAAQVGGNLGTAFSRNYYPAEAVRTGKEGRTTVAWTIDSDGKARDCRILGSSGVKDLDLTTCAVILQKTRWKPALDLQGKPIATYQFTAVRWSLD